MAQGYTKQWEWWWAHTTCSMMWRRYGTSLSGPRCSRCYNVLSQSFFQDRDNHFSNWQKSSMPITGFLARNFFKSEIGFSLIICLTQESSHPIVSQCGYTKAWQSFHNLWQIWTAIPGTGFHMATAETFVSTLSQFKLSFYPIRLSSILYSWCSQESSTTNSLHEILASISTKPNLHHQIT